MTLVNICDDNVQLRVARFEQVMRDTPAGILFSAFVFRSVVPYVLDRCFSRGDALEAPRWGSCWRCSLAWRLAARVPIAAAVVSAHDDARIVA